MEHIKAHIHERQSKKERATERGELMQHFMDQLNRARARDGFQPLTLARMGRILQAIPTKDLYYLKSVCDQASDFSKKFWWEVNPKKHTKSFARPSEASAKEGWEVDPKKHKPKNHAE